MFLQLVLNESNYSEMLIDGKQIRIDDSNIGESFHTGSIIIYFANLLKNMESYKNIENCFINASSERSTETYLQICHELLVKTVGQRNAKIMIMDAVNGNLQKEIAKEITTVKTLRNELKKRFNFLCSYAKSLADMVNAVTLDESKQHQYAMTFRATGGLSGEVKYSVHPACINDNWILLDIYSVYSGIAALELDSVYLYRSKANIKICANCGKYFIPSSRSDEIYCDSIFRNGKTCKQFGYENKINNDEILKAYRTIYKTQNARKQRNRGNKPNIDACFDEWKKDAKEQLAQCQSGTISLDTFKENISGCYWLEPDKGGIKSDGDDNKAE